MRGESGGGLFDSEGGLEFEQSPAERLELEVLPGLRVEVALLLLILSRKTHFLGTNGRGSAQGHLASVLLAFDSPLRPVGT